MNAHAVHLVILLAISAWPLLGSSSEAQLAKKIPAFPGAEGFGAYSVGGRGGSVYRVTTLADYGADEAPILGSFRAGVEGQGPRTIVFRVAGTIVLKRPLEIREPFLTVAAQTAPGDGISIANYGLEVYASDVILRYLRVRPGDQANFEQDAITVRGTEVIVDHCSVSWATDETLSVISQATNVTVQWCFITESLNQSVHHKGPHGYASLLTATGDVTIHHSVYALHNSRNPRPKDVTLDFRNNLVYGYGDEAGYNYDELTRMNYVGNYIIPLDFSRDRSCAFNLGGLSSRFYFSQNLLVDGERTLGDDEIICLDDGVPDDAIAKVHLEMPLAAPSVDTDSPEHAYERLLESGGATLPRRDPVDERVVGLIRNRKGRIIDSQKDVGGWPVLYAAQPPMDEDADGMSDPWEMAHGLNPRDAADHAGDLDGDGYTNLEEFLNGTDPRDQYQWVEPPVLVPGDGTAFLDSTLTITVETVGSDAPIYYTLDGSEPTTTSATYDKPIIIDRSAHVRARKIEAGTQTTSAYAEYERLAWNEALQTSGERIPGIRYTYYETWDWDDGPPVEELEPVRSGLAQTLDFGLHDRRQGFGLVFNGLLDAPRDGIYGFALIDDYHSVVRIDGHLITVGRAAAGRPGRIALKAGLHRLYVASLREGPRPDAVLEWDGPGIQRGAIPEAALYSTPVGN